MKIFATVPSLKLSLGRLEVGDKVCLNVSIFNESGNHLATVEENTRVSLLK